MYRSRCLMILGLVTLLAGRAHADACASIPAEATDDGSCRPGWMGDGELRKGGDYAQDPSYRCTVDVAFSDPRELDTQLLVIFDDREINCGCGTVVESFEFTRKLIDSSHWEKSDTTEWGGRITARVLAGINSLLLGIETETACAAHFRVTRQNLRGGSDEEIQQLAFSKKFELRSCTAATYLKVVSKRRRAEDVDLRATWTASQLCNRGGGTIVRVTFGGSDLCERCGSMSALGYQIFDGMYSGRKQGFQPRIVRCLECEKATFCALAPTEAGSCPDGGRCVDFNEPGRGEEPESAERVGGLGPRGGR